MTFPDFYSWAAEQMTGREAPRIVEIGTYAGQSIAYLGVELINRGVFATIDMVDRFEGGAHHVVAALEPIRSVLGTVRAETSWDAAVHYEDASLDFVFIDADHAYESVSRDIDAWLSKVKPGGLLAGHDYTDWPGFGVMRAVNERFTRFEIWPGVTHMGDTQMHGRHWPVWSVRC